MFAVRLPFQTGQYSFHSLPMTLKSVCCNTGIVPDSNVNYDGEWLPVEEEEEEQLFLLSLSLTL